MGAYQAFPDLQFQGRLHKSSEVYQVEVFHFLELLEEYGLDAIGVPRYSAIVAGGALNAAGRMEFLLKILGAWTSLWLEVRASNVFVVYDTSS